MSELYNLLLADARAEARRVLSVPVPRAVARALGCSRGERGASLLARAAGMRSEALMRAARCAPDEASRGSVLAIFRVLRLAAHVASAQERGACLDDPIHGGRTLLGLVAAAGNLALVGIMLSAGAGPEAPATSGRTPHDEVVAACDDECGTFCLGCKHEAVLHTLVEASAHYRFDPARSKVYRGVS